MYHVLKVFLPLPTLEVWWALWASSEVKPENHRELSQSPDVNVFFFFSAPCIGRESLFSVRSDIIRIKEMRDSHRCSVHQQCNRKDENTIFGASLQAVCFWHPALLLNSWVTMGNFLKFSRPHFSPICQMGRTVVPPSWDCWWAVKPGRIPGI